MFGGLSLAMSAMLVGAAGGGASASVRTTVPSNISTSSFTNSFTAMKAFKGLAAAGKGKVAAILPDTVSSTRYVEFDQPDITKALSTAGLSSSQYVVQNALGSDATQLTDAQTDISNGATVLLVDPLDSGVGAQIESYAKARGVKVIDYDRLTLGGSRAYYVSFNNVTVGKVMGEGLVSCVSSWKVKKPQVVVMHGAVTDNNATLFAQGYDSVINPYFKSGKWTAVAHTAGTWDPPTAETEFQAVYTAHPNVNAALIPNDETGAPIITYLQSLHVKPKSFPTTGQDATLTGLQNVLAGYQCGTVYKPITWRHRRPSRSPYTCGPARRRPSRWSTARPRTRRRASASLGLRDAQVGHHGEHERHGHQGQLRARLPALHRLVRERLHGGGHHGVAVIGSVGPPGWVVSTHERYFQTDPPPDTGRGVGHGEPRPSPFCRHRGDQHDRGCDAAGTAGRHKGRGGQGPRAAWT